MKRLLIFFLILVCSTSWAQSDNFDVDGIVRPTGVGWPTPTQVEPGSGFKNIVTPTVIVGPYAPVKIGVVPVGTKNIYISSFNGATLVGPSGIQSGTAYLAAGIIASGTTVKIDGIATTTPNIYFLSNESAASTTIKLAGWGQ